jgi:hypothetical protein
MAKMTISGEKSSPPVLHGGSSRRAGANTGSVTWRRIVTTGLRGSGLTQVMSAAAMITHL